MAYVPEQAEVGREIEGQAERGEQGCSEMEGQAERG